MSICKQFLGAVVFVMLTSQAWSQVATSPYSQYAIGETYSNNLANTQGSAGLGVSLPQSWYINNQNPALLVYNTFASFQGGMLGERITNSLASQKFKGGNMNYLVVAFPAKHNKVRNIWGTSLGLMPYSTLKYSFNYKLAISGKDSTTTGYLAGSGGLTQLYWSNGVRLTQDFSIGLKAGYIFGNLRRTDYTSSRLSTFENNTFMKGFKFDVGLSYSKDSIGAKNYRLSAGAVYSLKGNLRSFLNSVSTSVSSTDTLYSTSGQTHLPASITAGISISRDGKWALGTEFFYQDWSSFSSPTFQQDQALFETNLGSSWRASFGGEFTPDIEAVEGIIKKITYRLGATVEQYPFTPSNMMVKDVGVNFGVSVPTGRSSIDLGIKTGKRGNKSDQFIGQESYLKIYLGVTFNDIWFIKRKFD